MSMSHAPSRYTVSVRDLRPLVALTAEAGRSFERLVHRLRLPTEILTGEDTGSIELADYFRILEALSLEVQDETCRLSSRPLIPGSTHFVWSNVAGATDLLAAMKRVAEAYNMLHGGHYNRVELRDDTLVYVIDDAGFPYTSRDDPDYLYFTMECVLVFLHCTLMLISSDQLQRQLLRVYSRRPRPPAATRNSGQIDFLEVPIRWHAGNYALVYDLAAAFLPVHVSSSELPPPNAVYRKIIDLIHARQAERPRPPTTAERVTGCLDSGLRDQQAVAGRLGLSVATLRRRLEREGTSFRELRRVALNEAAKAMLGQGRHVAEIAEILDFADFRSFTRAFKQWNGMTPGHWCRVLRKGDATLFARHADSMAPHVHQP